MTKRQIIFSRKSHLAVLFAAALAVPVLALAAPAGASPSLPIPVPHIPLPIPLPHVNLCSPSAPPVEAPAEGIPGVFVSIPPNTARQPPASEFEQRGYAGLSWEVYDPGCAGVVEQPVALVTTTIGNLLLGVAKDIAAFGAGVHRLVSPPNFLHAFDPFLARATAALRRDIYVPWIGASLLIVGLLLLGRSYRGRMAASAKTAGWAIAVMTVATLIFDAPVLLAHTAEQYESAGASTISNSIAGSSGATTGPDSLVVSQVLYPFWLRGEVGTTNSQVAVSDGPKLLDGQSYTWTQATAAKKPDKSKEFTSAAGDVKAHDPAAYAVLKGQANGWDRPGAGLFALLGVLLVVPFFLFADFLVVASILILFAAIILLPVLVPILIHDRFQKMAKRTLLTVGAALWNGILFSAGAAIAALWVGLVLNPATGLNQWFGLALAGLACCPKYGVFWRALKALMASPTGSANPLHQITKSTASTSHQVTHMAKKAVLAAVLPEALVATAIPEAVLAKQARAQQKAAAKGSESDTPNPQAVSGNAPSNGSAPVAEPPKVEDFPPEPPPEAVVDDNPIGPLPEERPVPDPEPAALPEEKREPVAV